MFCNATQISKLAVLNCSCQALLLILYMMFVVCIISFMCKVQIIVIFVQITIQFPLLMSEIYILFLLILLVTFDMSWAVITEVSG